VFRWEKTEFIEEHKLQNYMLTEAGKNAVTTGSVMGAFFDSLKSDSTLVTIITKRKDSFSLFTGMTEGGYHKRFRQAVDIFKTQGILPVDAPPYPERNQRPKN
jgi:hypothetical protein